MARPTIEEYREQLKSLTNEELIDKAGIHILGAAILESRAPGRYNWDDEAAGACYDEAKRRGNSDLYQRGFNEAVLSQGHRGMVRKVETPVEVGEPSSSGGESS